MRRIHWRALALALLTVTATFAAVGLLIWAVLIWPLVLPGFQDVVAFAAFVYVAYLIWRDSLR